LALVGKIKPTFMDTEYVFKITCALYRVTEFLPENEPLRINLRQKALDVLGDVFRVKNNLKENIEIIQSYLKLTQEQGWLIKDNFIILARSYAKVVEQSNNVEPVSVLKQSQPKQAQRAIGKPAVDVSLFKARHKKIIDVLKQKGDLQIKDLNQFLPGVTRRTVLRDVNFLLEMGAVKRVGVKNNTRYVLK